MIKEIGLKVFGYLFMVLLLLNMVLFALRKISGVVFWSVILVGAIMAFWVVPRIGKKE